MVTIDCGIIAVGVRLTPAAEHVGEPTKLTKDRSASLANDA